RMPHYRAMADAVADLLADRQVFLLAELPAASLSPVDPEPTRPHEE
ncbi:putative quinol monooxygenase, partial [Pseudomonas aeruginosa]